ncbi:Ig-like domain-containing protein [Spongiimicrobium salis]|uniref:Ig-like domain-containing protein n=1 Tax=Spongiimicrobium salis TaxID=1667022 RepID=UPI00374D2C9B
MKTLQTSIFACLLFFSFSTLFSQVTISGELRKWHTVTLRFNGPNSSEASSNNPFLNYRLNVTFTSPSGNTFVVPGFFAADGNAAETSAISGNQWAVRFTPNETGRWTYNTSFRQGTNVAISLSPTAGSATSFNGTTGDFTIGNSNKTFPDSRARGRLNYVGERYLKFEETGNYFLKAGSDSPENMLAYEDFDNTRAIKSWAPHRGDWNSGDPSWKGGDGTEIIGAINYLAENGMNAFSFITMNVIGDGNDVWPWRATTSSALDGNSGSDAENRTRYDVSKLEQWEILFAHAETKGMFLHFKTQETENDQLLDRGELGTQRRLYYRELIARFGHHLMLNWNLGEEHDLYDFQELGDRDNSRVKAYAQYIRDLDPYDHHMVIHSYPERAHQNFLFTPLLGNQSELTGPSLQIQINDIHEDVKRWITDSRNSGKQWVVTNDEQGDAERGVTTDANFNGARGTVGDNRNDTRNKVLWGTLMAGGAGVEYYFGYSTGETDLTAEDFRSRQTKWNDARIALNFFNTYLPFWEMESNDELTSSSSDYVLADIDQLYAIYLPNGGSTNLNLSAANGTYRVRWFDPRNGGSLRTGSVSEIGAGGNRNIGTPPNNSAQDWVVLIEKTSDTNEVPDTEDCATDYVEQNSLVVIEAENLEFPSGWAVADNDSGFTGNGYITWNEEDHFNTPGEGVISATIQINDPGTYRFQWRSKVGQGTSSTDFNDSWLRFPDADDFFGRRSDGRIVYPHGSGRTPNPEGAGRDGWFKVYLSGTTNWTWSSLTNDGSGYPIFVTFDNPGQYTIEISARSNSHFIDRITLSKNAGAATNLALEETLCTPDDAPDDDPEVPVTRIRVTPQNGAVDEGDTLALSVQIFPSNASNQNLTWSSADNAIATVDQNGNVRGIRQGTVRIAARSEDGNFVSDAVITVLDAPQNDIPVSGIVLSPSSLSLDEGESANLTTQIFPSNATNQDITWSSSNSNIVTVNQNGQLVALQQGTATIGVITADGGFGDTTTVTVNGAVQNLIPITRIRVNPQAISIDEGDTVNLSAQISPSNATNRNLLWSSANPAIATVDQNGRVTAIREGNVRIAARTQDGTNLLSDAQVEVLDAPQNTVAVSGISTSPDTASINEGEGITLSAQISPSNATNQGVDWSSSNNNIASVDQNGRVTGIAAGNVIITGRTVDGGFVDTTSLEVVNNSIPVTRIRVEPQSLTMNAGESTLLSVSISPSNATNRNLLWSSANSAIATVDQNGRVQARREGVVRIAAVTQDGTNLLSDAVVQVLEADCEADYVEENNLVVIEAENLNFPAGWSRETATSGFSGDSYLEWEGGNNFNTPGNGVITVAISINDPGTYRFQWRNKVGEGTRTTDFNDSWLRFPDADDFFARNSSGSIVYPRGSGKNPVAQGSGADGWFKVYSSGTTNWTWSTFTNDGRGHNIFVTFDQPGVYTMEISGRSNRHFIDRIVLSKDAATSTATNLSLPETTCSGNLAALGSLPNLSISNATAVEGEPMDFVFQLSQQSNERITLDISFSNNSAHNNDYVLDHTSVTFEPGETSKTIAVPTRDDNTIEENETFSLAVTEVIQGKVANYKATALGTIIDEDKAFIVYPNSAKSGETISLEGIAEGSYQLSLFSMTGTLVQYEKVDMKQASYQFSLKNLTRGVYLMRVDGLAGSYTKKITIE